MASNGTQGTVSVSLHPLVIMNISEHWTRSKAQSGSPSQVYGAIIGKQKGRDIEIMNSFELDYNVIEGKVIIDSEYYKAKEEQFKQVFTEMDFLGWYSTGEMPSNSDLEIHKQITEFHESPLFLQMNPLARQSDLPVNMYESLFDLVGGNGMLFVRLSFTLATEEAERIGLDHVARISREEDDSNYSKVSEHVVVQHSAIKMLASRVRVILDYVQAVSTGELPHNHEILREAKALADRLPVLESSRFKPEFYSQYNDVALMTYLGSILKSSNNLNQYVNKLNVLFPRQGTCRRMRGLFF
eukprot:TRINITY_DN6539_c0_g1_i1.p1 TRINITY_DN6539_c0_g1~~TRINITY_DN6539_c0_g1_i1.p1  ORF type:complete len:339 (-),score=90.29 TRINITY_DN6539_c0_g1_i1:138-1034(-)